LPKNPFLIKIFSENSIEHTVAIANATGLYILFFSKFFEKLEILLGNEVHFSFLVPHVLTDGVILETK